MTRTRLSEGAVLNSRDALNLPTHLNRNRFNGPDPSEATTGMLDSVSAHYKSKGIGAEAFDCPLGTPLPLSLSVPELAPKQNPNQ